MLDDYYNKYFNPLYFHLVRRITGPLRRSDQQVNYNCTRNNSSGLSLLFNVNRDNLKAALIWHSLDFRDFLSQLGIL